MHPPALSKVLLFRTVALCWTLTPKLKRILQWRLNSFIRLLDAFKYQLPTRRQRELQSGADHLTLSYGGTSNLENDLMFCYEKLYQGSTCSS